MGAWSPVHCQPITEHYFCEIEFRYANSELKRHAGRRMVAKLGLSQRPRPAGLPQSAASMLSTRRASSYLCRGKSRLGIDPRMASGFNTEFRFGIFCEPLMDAWKTSLRNVTVEMASKENLWRTRNMGREAVEVAQDLVWAKGDETKITRILREKASRLVKVDLLAVLEELERQEHWYLALKVFDLVRKEVWYKPETALYAKIIDCLGKGHQQEKALRLFREMQSEGCEPKDTTYTAIIGAFCRDGLYAEGTRLLKEMQEAGIPPYDLTYKILIEACQNAGAVEEAQELIEERKRECGTEEDTPPKEIVKISRRM